MQAVERKRKEKKTTTNLFISGRLLYFGPLKSYFCVPKIKTKSSECRVFLCISSIKNCDAMLSPSFCWPKSVNVLYASSYLKFCIVFIFMQKHFVISGRMHQLSAVINKIQKYLEVQLPYRREEFTKINILTTKKNIH